MTERFLSLKEAEAHTGKSRSTLRRFVESITKTDGHPDRKLIEPTIDEVEELHAQNHPFSWRIDQTLLDREFRKEGSQNRTESTQQPQAASSRELVELLQESIAIMKTELDEKNKQIAQFQERQRESNLLLSQTTERIALLSGGQMKKSSDDEAVIVKSSSGERGSGVNDKSKSRKRSKPKRLTLWERLRKPVY